MNQKLIIILILIAGGISSSLAYGVTNGTIIVGDITITGTCHGCSKTINYVIDNTTVNATTLSFNSSSFSFSFVPDDAHAFDGFAQLQAQLTDNTWADVSGYGTSSFMSKLGNDYVMNGFTGGPPYVKVPYEMRLIVEAPPTTGTQTIHIQYEAP